MGKFREKWLEKKKGAEEQSGSRKKENYTSGQTGAI